MNCKNCNISSTVRFVYPSGWCDQGINALIAREEAARASGWMRALLGWHKARANAPSGEVVPLHRAIESAFEAGWAARGLPSRAERNPVGDKSDQRTFTLFWLDGTTNVIEGENIADAMRRTGFGAGALRALDFHSIGDTRDRWRFINGHWDRIENLTLQP